MNGNADVVIVAILLQMTTTGYVDGVTSHDNDVNGLMSVEMPETKLKLLTTTQIIKITNS